MEHLPLPAGQPLDSRRARGNPVPERIVPRVRHGAELSARLEQLAEQVPAELGLGDDEDARVVLKFRATTRLSNGPLAKLRFTTLGEGEGWTYFVLSTRESRAELAAVLAEYTQLSDGLSKDVDWSHPKSWAQFVDRIDGIELYGPEDRADQTLTGLVFAPTAFVDCLLWPAPNAAAGLDRLNRLVAAVGEYARTSPSVHVVAVDARPDRLLARVAVDPTLLDELLRSADVERVRAPLSASVSQANLTATVMPSNPPSPAKTPIGVVDGIVNMANPLTGPYISASGAFPTGHTFSGIDDHGTAVAGIAIWGDLDPLVTAGTLSTPHPVISARVMEPTSAGTISVVGLAHLTIESAIRWLVLEHGVRVLNLSINQPVAASAALRDELTVTIDSLARELDVVIVVSAGNRTDLAGSHWLNDYPGYLNDHAAKIAAPGDAALAVTVGSHAVRDTPGGRHAATRVAIAGAQQPSPFTRSGPTVGVGRGVLKPEFTAHGGNWCWDHQNDALDVREPGTAAVVPITPTGGRIVGSKTGTSFAAPAVAHEIARLADRFPDAGANLLRALAALSARSLTRTLPGFDTTYLSGYGQPDAERVLESGPHRVFLTFQGSAPTNRVIVHRLPIPREFAEGVRQRTFRVALAFDPPVRRGRREYVAGTMAVELVRGLSLREVTETYARQPSLAEAAADVTVVRHALPEGDLRPSLTPGANTVASNTLIRREFLNGAWDPDHGDYFLVVSHNLSPCTAAQRAQYAEQTYALAVEIAEETESALDLYAAIRARLRPRARVR